MNKKAKPPDNLVLPAGRRKSLNVRPMNTQIQQTTPQTPIAILMGMNSQSLRNLIPLVQRRETLQAEMHKLEADIQHLVDGKPTIPMPTLREEPAESGRRNGMGKRIKSMLKQAGASGMDVSDVAARLGKKKAGVQQWFYQQTNNAPWLRKIATGVYAHK